MADAIPQIRALWHVTLFGTLCATDPLGVRPTVTRFRTQRAAALLAYLAFYKGMHAREMLAEMLWHDTPPDVSRTRLKQELATLRRHLETDGIPFGSVLRTDGNTHIGLTEGAVATDVARFETLIDQADAANITDTDAQPLLQEAVLLHGNEGLLAGRYEAWVSDERERLRLLYASALQRITLHAVHTVTSGAGGAGKLRISAEAWSAARRAVQAAPYDEASHTALIRLHLAEGDTAAARAQFDRWAKLADEGGEDPPSRELRRLVENAEAGKETRAAAPSTLAKPTPKTPPAPQREAPATPAAVPARLPLVMDKFFGRDAEIGLVCDLLGASDEASDPVRLVTLTGPGGMGKTRISLEIARRIESKPDLAGGFACVAFAPLAGVSDAAFLWNGVLSAVFPRTEGDSAIPAAVPGNNASAQSHLIDLLQSCAMKQGERGRFLLVLDNLEQIAETSAPLLAEFLQAAPFVSCLVTSRQRLHIAGEQEVSVHPWQTDVLLDSDTAVEKTPPPLLLFAERARAARPDFTLNERNRALIADLCGLVDGIPLAIEIAAARVGMMGLVSLRDALTKNRLDTLVSRKRDMPERHRTLRDTIAWSYKLLPVDARKQLARLSVFRSGWTIAAAQAVGGFSSDAEVLPTLDILHDHHLINSDEHEPTGETRFAMLEILRQWASEQLSEWERAENEARFAAFYLDLVSVADLELRGERERYWLARLDAEHDNLRAALVWTIEDAKSHVRPKGDPLADAALRLCDELTQYWQHAGHIAEGRIWYKDVFAATSQQTVPRANLSDAFRAYAVLAHCQDDYDEARDFAQRALDVARLVGQRRCEAYAHGTLGRIALNCGAFQTACDHIEQAVALFALYDPKPEYIANMEAIQRRNWGIALLALGKREAARNCFDDAMAYWRSRGMVHRSQIADSLEALGELEGLEGKIESAHALLNEALTIRREINVKGGTADVLLTLARLHQGQGALSPLPFLRESLVGALAVGNRRGVVEAIEEIAICHARNGREASAAFLWGIAACVRRYPSSLAPSVHYAPLQRNAQNAARAVLGDDWAKNYEQGYAAALSSPLPKVVETVLQRLEEAA